MANSTNIGNDREAPPPDTATKPVEDSVPKVDNSVAVGEDIQFQRRWWKFERGVWVFFGLIVLCDLLGVFGRGFAAKAERRAVDQTVDLHYDKIERANTPSTMTVQFGPSAMHNGEIHLFVSASVVKDLGAERISPQPAVSAVGLGGITYTFPAIGTPATVSISLSPSYPGVYAFRLGVSGAEMVNAKVAVLP